MSDTTEVLELKLEIAELKNEVLRLKLQREEEKNKYSITWPKPGDDDIPPSIPMPSTPYPLGAPSPHWYWEAPITVC